MTLIADIAGWLCILTGSAFILIGAIGILRLPDVFTRMHAAGIIDTLGIGLIILGLITQAGFTLITVKLALIVIFLVFTGPTATHALARAVLNAGVSPILAENDHEENKPSQN